MAQKAEVRANFFRISISIDTAHLVGDQFSNIFVSHNVAVGYRNMLKKSALAGNRTPVSRVAGENSTTEPTMLVSEKNLQMGVALGNIPDDILTNKTCFLSTFQLLPVTSSLEMITWNMITRNQSVSFYMKGSRFQLTLICQQFCSVVVITFASHAKGPRFEPGQNQYLYRMKIPKKVCLDVLSCGLLP